MVVELKLSSLKKNKNTQNLNNNQNLKPWKLFGATPSGLVILHAQMCKQCDKTIKLFHKMTLTL